METEVPEEEEAEGEDILLPPLGAVRRASGGSGRRVGPSRRPPVVAREEDTQIGRTYRQLVYDLLCTPSLRTSGHSPDEEPGSDPDDNDGTLVEGILHLEQFRPRPSSRGGIGRSGLPGPIPRDSASMSLGRIPRRRWDTIPRGAVSEWFPRLPFSPESGECSACEGDVVALREFHRRRRRAYSNFASRNNRRYTSALGVLPLMDWSENRLRCLHGFGNHTCECGRPVSFQTVLFTPQGGTFPIENVRNVGIQLNVHLHMVAPGVPMSWSATSSFSGVFPLFGLLRRFWGRFVLIRGHFSIMGYPPRSTRNPLISHTLSLFVHSRHSRALRHAPLEMTGHVTYAPRGDVFLYGASLQWEGNGDEIVETRLAYPQEVSLAQMRRSFLERVPPYSFASLHEGIWTPQLPDRTIEALEEAVNSRETGAQGSQPDTMPSPKGRQLP